MLVYLLSLFGICFLSSTLVPFPSELAVSHAFILYKEFFYLILLVASVGNTLGGVVNYVLGILARKKYVPNLNSRVQSLVSRFGVWTAFFSFLPFVGDPMMFVLGYHKVSKWKCFLFSFVGKIARYAILFGVILE